MMILCAIVSCFALAEGPRPAVVVVVGAPGQPDYASAFRDWADRWETAARRASADFLRIGMDGDGDGDANANDRERLRDALASRSTASADPLWLVLIGHGTFDGREAKFNLRGPDVTDSDLEGWLATVKRPIVLLNCSSSSGPFLNKLSGPDRVIVTATRSGDEQNFARCGQYLAEAIADPSADLDKDGQTSLLEAYLTAVSRVEEFYKTRARLATEHALLDDNGDKLGTPADFFRGVRAVKRPRDGAALDGVRAHQIHLIPSDRERRIPTEIRQKRDAIERAVATLREQKATLAEDEYYERLDALMLDLARLYRDLGEANETR
ncbi:MAG: hypothetical protein AB7I30_13305 [Isosphaeraceae bacterium]